MAGKRKAKRTTPPEDLSKPSRWRLQHGGFDEGVRGTDPDTGTPILHRRAIDSLGVLLANGSITREMHEAGVIFRGVFQRAALDRVRVMPMIRIPGGTADLLSESQAVARERVARAMRHLGGFASPAGSIAWYVLGLEHSVRDWALRQGWNGRAVNPAQAQGILLGALGMLGAHYGLTRPASVAFGAPAPASAGGGAAKSAQA
ncbi:hypothetical protein [Rubritepida flocculans]|jgi:hypothetical protein|uniref:hypothetical protein n=1 Tax=Rubritepida flocculans TaxID=182403 RepID=UPI00041759A9|nr:hypothetical protein [Rubritepida flocculans]